MEMNIPEKLAYKETKIVTYKLITYFFSWLHRKTEKKCITGAQVGKTNSNDGNKHGEVKKSFSNKKLRDIPSWRSIIGTPFRVVCSLTVSPSITYDICQGVYR